MEVAWQKKEGDGRLLGPVTSVQLIEKRRNSNWQPHRTSRTGKRRFGRYSIVLLFLLPSAPVEVEQKSTNLQLQLFPAKATLPDWPDREDDGLHPHWNDRSGGVTV